MNQQPTYHEPIFHDNHKIRGCHPVTDRDCFIQPRFVQGNVAGYQDKVARLEAELAALRAPKPPIGFDTRSVGHEDRVGYYMHTASGLPYWPCDPRVEEVRIEDIAHHLSMQCRFAGASTRFLSVAEHSIACSFIGPDDEALERLMHDAAEAYLQDWIRPIKYLPEVNAIYTQLEVLNEKVIAEKFGLTYPFPPSVKIADEAVVSAELAQNIAAKKKGHMHDSSKCPHIHFEYWEPEEAKFQFLARYAYLKIMREHLSYAA